MSFVDILLLALQCLILALATTTAFAYMTFFERRLLARMQNRVGPNRAGPGGFLQPLADALKLFFKEDIVPVMADRWVYLLAPAMAMIPAIIIWATIPLGCWALGSAPDPNTCVPAGGRNLLHLADVNVGVLYLLAVTGVGVYGIAIAGWASNNKYSMLGGIRASAQVISYELALSLAVLGVVMQANTFSTSGIVAAQSTLWNIVPQFLGGVIFLVASTAEVVRAPFDLVEAEQELAGGYNIEYGSMKFALFFMAEYIKLIAMGAIAVTLYFGGWRFPGLEQLGAGVQELAGDTAASVAVGLASLGAFLLKLVAFLFVSVWVRATVPRIRYDQLMNLGWKVLLPLALLNVALTAVLNVLLPGQELIGAGVSLVIGLVALVVAARTMGPRNPNRTITLVKKPTV